MQCCKASYTRSTLLSVPVWSKTMHQHTQNSVQWFSGFSVYPQPCCRYYWHWSQMPSRKPHKPTMWLWDRSHGDVPLWIEHNEDDHKRPLMFKHSAAYTYKRSYRIVWPAYLCQGCTCFEFPPAHIMYVLCLSFLVLLANPLIGK